MIEVTKIEIKQGGVPIDHHTICCIKIFLAFKKKSQVQPQSCHDFKER